ncbi:MAG: hypothetical protein AAB562_02920 [Patescibacteria group bacterium]
MPIKRRKIKQAFSRAKGTLHDIAETLEYIYATAPYRMPPNIDPGAYRVWKFYKEQAINRRHLYAAKRSKLIETRKAGERMMIRLTDKGYRKVLRAELRDTKKRCPDGICLVTFDIPESQKTARDTLRRLLRECGFKQLHRSVWFTENDAVAPFCAFVRANNLTPWVYVFVGKIASAGRC